MAILEVKNLEKNFGTLDVLKGISFSLEEGAVLSIIGSSGSGKTTLLRCLNFLETPDKGQILVKGERLFDAEDPATQKESGVRKKRLHFGLVFQSFNLFPQYTALQNVTLAPELLARQQPDFRQNKAAILAAIQAEGKALLDQVGLSDKLGSYPHQLSGGQQQRVAIARALVSEAPVILADEPTGNLDEQTAGDIIAILKKLAKERQKCVIVVTHSKEVAEASDVVLELSRRSLVEKSK